MHLCICYIYTRHYIYMHSAIVNGAGLSRAVSTAPKYEAKARAPWANRVRGGY
jgi:hypothetical protein